MAPADSPEALADDRSYRSVEHEPDLDAPKKGQGGEEGDDDEGGDDKDDKKGGEKKKGLLQRPIALIVGAVVLAVLILLAVLFWLNARKYQSSDDAFVDARIVHLAPQVSGRVLEVTANDNQLVGAGQLLVQIDPADYQARLDQAVAQRAQAAAQETQARAQLAQAQAQVSVSQATVDQSLAQTRAQQAQAFNAARDYQRYLNLQRMNPAAVAQQQIDSAQATALNTAAQRDAAAQQARASAAQVTSTRTQIGQAQAQVVAAQAALKTADAQVEAARLNVGYTHLVSPVTGHVTRRTVAVGAYLQAGQETMAIVPQELWVTANFKETQLTHMRPGQGVDIKVDAYKGVAFHGHVDSIQRGAGQAFQVLPAENATGNYVKVVQRVPVKIVFDNPDPHYPLGPGMSVSPKVRVQ